MAKFGESLIRKMFVWKESADFQQDWKDIKTVLKFEKFQIWKIKLFFITTS